ncbi:hypothetical protein AVEN_53262-1 [Araneus ventricosus]|uniref:Uncharacterized protein n=1 Tax=Araneus ventricosus TaxID=182803 RepID=A0A4Y2AB03_ARAVE|nr:hypothetical protein AVEN_53262-1 [Araneus ventricosus]
MYIEAVRHKKAFGWSTVVSSLRRKKTHAVHASCTASSSLLFSAARYSDVTGDDSAIYRYSAAAGGPHIWICRLTDLVQNLLLIYDSCYKTIC